MRTKVMSTNPEIEQDRVEDTVEHFNKFGYVMFPQQVKIYLNLASYTLGKSVLEVGCGNGVGTAILERTAKLIKGTDKLFRNIKFARCLYPWMQFDVWDINQPLRTEEKYPIVVCVETIEHVANPKQAIQNLLDVCTSDLWISTPNGIDKERPPSNPYHVQEYTPKEMIELIGLPKEQIELYHWDTMERMDCWLDDFYTLVDPLIYKVTK